MEVSVVKSYVGWGFSQIGKWKYTAHIDDGYALAKIFNYD